MSGEPTLADLGVRLTEFEYMGGKLAKNISFMKFFEEQYGDLDPAPLPLRSPPLIKGRFDENEVFNKAKTPLRYFTFKFSQ